MSGPPLLDLHHLGHRQTGNESWVRSLSATMFALDGPSSYDIAVTSAAAPTDLALVPARESVLVSGSSTRRLAVDLPRAMKRFRSSAVLVQYTVPVSRVPAVVMVHDLSFEDPRAAEWLPWATRQRYRTTIRVSVRRAAHLLTVSEFSKSDLVRCYGVTPSAVTVVPVAVDPRLVALLADTPEDRSGPLTVLMVGNVLPRKNLPVVARAVRLLRDRGTPVRLRVVGTVAPTGRRDADLARQLLGDAIFFTGYVDQAVLARELRSAHVLAFPSLYEGFGIPAIEAMAAGLPLIVSDRGALSEVVGDAGVVVPAEDVEAWADALRGILASGANPPDAAGVQGAHWLDWHGAARTVSRLLANVGAG